MKDDDLDDLDRALKEGIQELLKVIAESRKLLMPCDLCGKATHKRGFFARDHAKFKKLGMKVFAICEDHDMENKAVRDQIAHHFRVVGIILMARVQDEESS